MFEKEQSDGHFAIIYTRLDALEAAIRAKDWKQTEFEFDRVLRSVQKLEREVKDV